MGVTRTTLRQRVAQVCGLPFISGTTTASTATTATDAPVLGRFPTSTLIGFFFYFPDATVPHRLITANTVSTGVVTMTPSSSAGMDGTDSYEVLPFPADAIHSAIDLTLRSLYLLGVLGRKFWIKAVGGSPIYNAGFDYWTSSSALHGWDTATATLTRLQTAAGKYIGENAVQLGTAAGTLTLAAPWARFLSDLKGSVNLRAWAKTSAASNARAGLADDAGTYTNTNNHSGDGEWEMVYKSPLSLTDSDTERTVRLQTQTTDTASFSEIWIEGGGAGIEHPFPIALIPDGPSNVYISNLGANETNKTAWVRPRNMSPYNQWDWHKYHDEAANVEYGVLVWRGGVPRGKRVWLECEGPLTLPTADTGVVEINDFEAMLVARMAASHLLTQRMDGMPELYRAKIREKLARLNQEIERDMHKLDDDSSVALPPDFR